MVESFSGVLDGVNVLVAFFFLLVLFNSQNPAKPGVSFVFNFWSFRKFSFFHSYSTSLVVSLKFSWNFRIFQDAMLRRHFPLWTPSNRFCVDCWLCPTTAELVQPRWLKIIRELWRDGWTCGMWKKYLKSKFLATLSIHAAEHFVLSILIYICPILMSLSKWHLDVLKILV